MGIGRSKVAIKELIRITGSEERVVNEASFDKLLASIPELIRKIKGLEGKLFPLLPHHPIYNIEGLRNLKLSIFKKRRNLL